MKYRKKPVEIEAVQWNGDNLAELRKMDGFDSAHWCLNRILCIITSEELTYVPIGYYIVKGAEDDFYPCDPDIFEETYDEVVE